MIRYNLTCAKGHRFDSWFQSADAFDDLMARGMVSCAVCGGGGVEKGLMAPNVASGDEGPRPERPLSAPASPAEQVLAELRKTVEDNAEYVGLGFAKEARDIHQGEAPDRPIYGEAKLDEAKKLIEEGVPVAPLPFAPRRKTN